VKARAIRKRLMRGRTVSFWGRRAYFTVRVPMSAYPEPLPADAASDEGSGRERWVYRWVRGYNHPTGSALPDALIDTTWCASATYPQEADGGLLLTYSVKWFYPDRKRDFCSAMARAFRAAKAAGVDMRYTEDR
jgi:hypothetical protein